MVCLQEMTPVDQSMVWTLLDQFYIEEGPKAWSEDIVPQGSTANCYTADTYARIAAAFLRDMENLGTEKPLIIELGGGNGRFAWQFLNRLNNYHASEDNPLPDFTYLLTDAAQNNLKSWQSQQRFKNLVASGMLEFGTLWVEENPTIHTQTGQITPSDLRHRPILIIANYLFDSIKSNMLHIKDHQFHQVLMSLESEKSDLLDKPVRTFEGIKEKFSSRPIAGPDTGDALLDEILTDYLSHDEEFYVVVPEIGFKFLKAFTERRAPMMMIAGDLAYSDPDEYNTESPFIFDSYFAHYTNFHIFQQLFERKGGHTQFQRHKDIDFSNAAFLMPGDDYEDVRSSFARTIPEARASLQEFYPYDAHELTEMISETVEEASFRQVLAWLRFSKFDPEVAQACLPMLFEELQQGQDEPDAEQLYESYMEAYQAFFPDGQQVTFDYTIAQLFLGLKLNKEARDLLEQSIEEFGPSAARLYVYALVLIRLKKKKKARTVLQEALDLDANYGPALRLYEENYGSGKPDAQTLTNHLSVSYTDKNVTRKVAETFDKYGAVLIEDMIQPDLLKALQGDFNNRVENWRKTGLGVPNSVGDKRFTVPIRFTPPFDDAALYANPVLIELLTEAMGAEPVISAFGAVVTHAGARMQHVHREHPHIFTSDEAMQGLPTYAVTVLIPLVDLDEAYGGTQLWEGSHKSGNDDSWEGDPTVVYTRAGSALVFDYRIYHGGMPCTSDKMRPVLFFSYALPWFRDTLAYESHAAFGLTKQEKQGVPEAHKGLFRFANMIAE